MKVARFEAKCKDCSNIFLIPLLSDFSYGEFIAKGQFGKGFVYLNSFEEKAWTVIDEIIKSLRSKDKNKEYEESGYFQKVVGKCIDKTDEEEFSIVSGPICPKCLSHKIDYDDREIIDFHEIPEATFNVLMNLKEEERKKFVEKIWFDCLNN
jgi:hypothetical protein